MKISLSLVVLGLAAAVSAQDGSFQNNFPAMTPSAHQVQGAGMGGGGVDSAPAAAVGAPPTNNYGNINRNLTTFKAPAVKEKDKKKDDGKGQPQMPQMPQGGGEGKEGGGEGGGGGCKGACGKVDGDISELDKAAATMKASKDSALMGIGERVAALSGQAKDANDQLKEAGDQMSKAKDALKKATDDLKKFAEENKKDADKIKKVADEAKKKGEEAKDCPAKEPPASVGNVSGDPKRSAKFPSGAEGQIKEAETALKAARTSIAKAKRISGTMDPEGGKIVTDLAAAQSRLGKVDPGLARIIQRTQADLGNAVEVHHERLNELRTALQDAKKSLSSGQKADKSSETAEKAVTKAKTQITSGNAALDAAGALYQAYVSQGLTGMSNPGCMNGQSANSTIKLAAQSAQQPAQTAVTDASPAVSDAGTASSSVGSVGEI